MHFVDCIFDSSSHLPPNLRHLLGVGCSPDAPLDLAPLTALERLHLSYGHSNGSPVEGDSLLGLERLDRLTSLSVSACSTMPSQLSALAALRRLDLSTQSGVRAYPAGASTPTSQPSLTAGVPAAAPAPRAGRAVRAARSGPGRQQHW